MKKLNLLAFVFACIAFGMVSCSKGSAGAAGATGATGPAGPAGPTGSGNITYSAWTTLAMDIQNIEPNSGGGADTIYSQSITAPAITSSIIDQGIILSYIGIPGGASNGTDTAVLSISEASTFIGVFTQQFSVGEIDIFSLDFDYSGFLYRYVVVPGSVAAGNSILKNYTKDQLKAIDYSTLKKALNITSAKASNN